MSRKSPYPRELRERAVRMVREVRPQYSTEAAAIKTVVDKLGIGSAESLRKWLRDSEAELEGVAAPGREESAELKQLRRENAELRRANEILKAASAYFARELDPRLPR
jgi:transposase